MLKPFTTFEAPALARLNGRLTIIPTYQKVPEGTTLDDVLKAWTRKVHEAPGFRATNEEMEAYLNGTYKKEDFKKIEAHKEFQIENSKKTGHYMVTYHNGTWNCNCVGFGYRNKCKHVQSCKDKI